MLDPAVLRILGKYLNIGYYFGWIPYSFSKKENRVCFNESKRCLFRFWINLILLFLYATFLAVQTTKLCREEGISPPEKIKSVYLTTVYILMGLEQIVSFKHYGEQHFYINSFLETTTDLKEKFEGDFNVQRKSGLEKKLMYLFIFGNFFATVTRGLAVFRKPDSRVLLSSLAVEPKKLPLWMKGIICIVHLYVTGFQTYTFLSYTAIFFCYVASLLPAVERLKLDPNKTPSRRAALQIVSMQHELGVLQRNVNAIYGILPLLMQVIAFVLAILNFSMAVVYDDERAFLRALMVIIGMIFIFIRFAEVYTASTEAAISWRNAAGKMTNFDGLWFKRFVRSVQPIKINIGGFFYADRELVLTIITVVEILEKLQPIMHLSTLLSHEKR